MARQTPKVAQEGRSGSGYSGPNSHIGSEQHMLIIAANSDLADFTDNMFGQIEASLEAQGGKINVTPDQFRRYCVTAMKVRVEHVSKSTWRRDGYPYTGMTVHEGWALPVPMHDVLSSIGNVRVGTGEIIIKPLWATEADDLVIEKSERDRITRELRSACGQLNIRVLGEISSDLDGHHATMVLVYLPMYGEWWSDSAVKREDAAAALLSGVTPVQNVVRGTHGAEYAIVDTNDVASHLLNIPTWTPEYKMDKQVVVRYLNEMAKLVG